MVTVSIPSTTTLDSDTLYEVVNGEIVEIEPMGAYATWIASLLLQTFAGQQNQGRAVSEMLFDLSGQVGTKRRPDLAFVSYARWPREKPILDTEAWDVVPNLAVDAVSPSNTARAILDRVEEYFRAGVERVWVIYPSQRLVYVYASPTDLKVIPDGSELTDESLLPGFRLPLQLLFGPPPAAK
ncbi:MAG: Uma2 family endonuclease [Planctomycetes bacterium]|nr:Uma2 family endonuclease [Planctomycetota bacterium]